MDRAERWRIVLEKLKIAVPKDYQYYIQFKNNLLTDSELDANIPWLNVVNLFTSNDSWSHLLFLKYFSSINPKPDLKIKDILTDILKDTNISTYRNYSCAKIISIVGTTEELKISNIIKNLIEKDIQNISKSESLIYQESIKNAFVTENLDSVKISFVSLFIKFSQIYKNKSKYQMVIMTDILNYGIKFMQFYNRFKKQYDKHNLLIENWKEILAKIKYHQYDKQKLLFKNWKEILAKTKVHKCIIYYELIMEDITLSAFNNMKIHELRKCNNMNENNNVNKIIKSGNNLCINENIWEIIDIKDNIKKYMKIIMVYNLFQNLFQMEYMENQLVLIILNKYQQIQEYINKKIKMNYYYGIEVQKEFKWLFKNGQIKIVEQLI